MSDDLKQAAIDEIEMGLRIAENSMVAIESRYWQEVFHIGLRFDERMKHLREEQTHLREQKKYYE